MKQIVLRIVVIAVMASWTFLALASTGSCEHSCKREWKTAFKSKHAMTDEHRASNTEATSVSLAADGMLPGSVQSFLFQ